MSDDLRKAFEEMRQDLGAVKERLGAVEDRLGVAETAIREAREAIQAGTRTFSTFLVRFDEVSEMLVQHDTEQLQRVASVERENAALKEHWQERWAEISARVEALEKKAG